MSFEPRALDLRELFSDGSMFHSRKTWARAGFSVFDPAKDTEVMVAAHPSASGYLFKRYTDAVSRGEQRDNYAARVEGAERVARLIEKERLVHVVAPKKFLHDLPEAIFGKKQQVLVVERLDLVGTRASEDRYRHVDEHVLRDLLSVLVRYPGLDSNSKNVQFTTADKIAFVDLENWARADRREVRLKSIGTYLSKNRRQLATKILATLR